MKKPMLQIWDLTRLEDMRDAWQMLETAKSEKNCHYKDYKVALRAAIECYSSSKASPLHTTIQNNHLQSMQVCRLSSKHSWAHDLTVNSIYLYLWHKQDCPQTEICRAANACRCASNLMHQVLPASRTYEIIFCTLSVSALMRLATFWNKDSLLRAIVSLWMIPSLFRALTISTWIMFISLLKPHTPSSLARTVPARTHFSCATIASPAQPDNLWPVTDTILSFVQLAIRLGASLEMKDQTGATPLFAACENGQYKLVQALLSSGSRPTTRNRSEEAPLYIAALKGHIQTVEVLLQGFEDMQIDWIVSLSLHYSTQLRQLSDLCLNIVLELPSLSWVCLCTKQTYSLLSRGIRMGLEISTAIGLSYLLPLMRYQVHG